MTEVPHPVDNTRIEPATLDDLEQMTDLLVELFKLEADFEPDRAKQEHGLRLIIEQPNRGRIFVLRNDHQIIGMINLLFTISTAEGGLVILMEDVFIHPHHRRQGYGTRLMNFVKQYALEKGFRRITLLTDQISEESQLFFKNCGFIPSSMIPMRLTIKEN